MMGIPLFKLQQKEKHELSTSKISLGSLPLKISKFYRKKK